MLMCFRCRIAVAAAAGLASLSAAQVQAAGPYSADANTIALYHFEESSGSADPGNPFVNLGSAGTALNLSNTGGPDGRGNNTGGGYGATSYTGYGSGFNALAAGDNLYHTTASTTGGGATIGGTITQASLQGADGAFTYEAMINLQSATTAEQTILSHDGLTNRGFSFRIIGGKVSFYTGAASAPNTFEATIPTAGAHAFDASKWYHVAVAYNGGEAVTGNTKFYWTAMDSGATAANEIGTATMPADVSGLANALAIGTPTRSPFRFEMEMLDEVRISSIARGPTDFVMVPEPASLGLLAATGLLLAGRRRRRQ